MRIRSHAHIHAHTCTILARTYTHIHTYTGADYVDYLVTDATTSPPEFVTHYRHKYKTILKSQQSIGAE